MCKPLIEYNDSSFLFELFANMKNAYSVLTLMLKTPYKHTVKNRNKKGLRFTDEFKGEVFKFSIKNVNIWGDRSAYERYVNKNRKAEGIKEVFKTSEPKGMKWYNEYGLLMQAIKTGKYQLRYYFHNANSGKGHSVVAYEDGTPLTDEEKCILFEDYTTPLKEGSGRQGTEKKELPNNVHLDNILGMNAFGKRYRLKA